MPLSRRLVTLLAGLIAGLVATATLLLLMVAGRYYLGVTPPPEAIPDRTAPLLELDYFLDIMRNNGGYNGLKELGIRSGIQGVTAMGLLVGLIYPLVAESRRSRRAGLAFDGRWDIPRHGVGYALGVTFVLWLVSIAFLWPVLVTSYVGLPPFDARLVTAAWYLLSYLAYGAALVFTYRAVTLRTSPMISHAAHSTFVIADPASLPSPGRESRSEASAERSDPGAGEGLGERSIPEEPVVGPSVLTDAVPITAARADATPAPGDVTPEPSPAASRRLPGLDEPRLIPVARLAHRRAVLAVLASGIIMLPAWSLFRRLWGMTTFVYDGRTYGGAGIQPITPNDQFYSVTKNIIDPRVNADRWRLEVWGLVNRRRTYSLDDLQQLAGLEQETTLMCISNNIGQGLFSNAVWTGVRLRTVLGETGIREGAVEVKLYGADGFTDSYSIDRARNDGPMLAWQMNGEPLPQKHGGPVRLITTGQFGEKSVKWITGIEVVDHDAKGFYEQQGWGPNFEPWTRSDFFAPQISGRRFRDSVAPGTTVTFRGRAFAGDRGIRSVEFSPDDGQTWRPTRFTYEPSNDYSWTFWEADWTVPAQPGEYRVTSRAVDGRGDPQRDEESNNIPNGSRAYHRVTVVVE
ncbi:MAG TPA: molybdopterin-dependent oxidoreductase [Thermomicrobiales bacterium]|nr:molybdopterin-dependent oxidoreductase [Thermomicrobiales bacterium]